MQSQTKFCVCFSKINTKFFSDESNFPLLPKVEYSPNIKKLFLRLSEWDDELLPTPKTITFLAVSLSILH